MYSGHSFKYLHAWSFFRLLFSLADFSKIIPFQKNLSGTLSECPDLGPKILQMLYQQKSKFAPSKERVKYTI